MPTGDGTQIQSLRPTLQVYNQALAISGNVPIDAFINALGMPMQVHHYEEHARNYGSNADAIAYIEIAGELISKPIHVIGIHPNIVTASLMAILSAVNRAWKSINQQTQAQLIQNLAHRETVITR